MDHEKHRKALCKCQACYNQKLLVGQAFRSYECLHCQQIKNHPNTGVPQICPECAVKADLCSYCLKIMD